MTVFPKKVRDDEIRYACAVAAKYTNDPRRHENSQRVVLGRTFVKVVEELIETREKLADALEELHTLRGKKAELAETQPE